MSPKTFDFSSLVPEREEKWNEMTLELAREGIKRIDIWGDNAPVHPLGNGFEAGLYLLAVHDGEPRGTIIICAGGALMFKSANEAKPVAEYFHKAGYNAAILDYTVNSMHSNAPTDSLRTLEAAGNDALQAIRYLRAHANTLRIRPDRIALGGFSAGGHTAQMAATYFDYGDLEAKDPLRRVSSRPDAVLLLYGASGKSTAIGNLGYDADVQNMLARVDPIRNIGCDCPPCFIFQTNSDDPRSSLLFAMELANRGISYEVHTFTKGPHGGGLYDGLNDTPKFDRTAKWAELAAGWLQEQGF